MNIEKAGNLSFYNEQGILTLNAKQFDTGRILVFHIMDNDEPFDLSGCTAYLRIAKADGTQFQGHECCTVEGSKVIIKTNVGNGSQILAAAGTNVCELHLEDSDGISLTTWTFHIVVEPRVHDGSNMSSIDSYDVLDNMINMEKDRIASEEQRKENELQRKENEANRNTVFEEKIGETNAVITDCQLVIDAANEKISSFDAEINEIVDGITDEAQSYADNAKASETNAANAASSAADSAATASQKAGDAAASAVLSQSYAVGGTQSRAGEDVDNAKYYSEKSQETLQKLQETTVTSIKGNAESAYRTGDVNITPDNIGALSLKGGTVSGKVTVNNSFIVNKTSTTSPTGITELDIHNDGKVAINTTANGGAGNSLIHFEGSVDGTITNKASLINSYVRTIQQQQHDLNIFSGNAINFKAKDFKVEDYKRNGGLKIDGGDVYIGDVSSVDPNYLDSDNGRTRLCIQSHPDLQSRTNLFTDSFYVGRQTDWFLECSRYDGWKKVKIRYGKNGSNIDCGNGWFSMWANDNGIQIYNTNSVMGDIHLSRNDGTSLFSTDIILQGNTEYKADLYLETGNIFGQRGTSRYNHAIKLGHNQDNVMRFYEVGVLWEFWANESQRIYRLDHQGIRSDGEVFDISLGNDNQVFRFDVNGITPLNSLHSPSLGNYNSAFHDMTLKGCTGIDANISIVDTGDGYSATLYPAYIYFYHNGKMTEISTDTSTFGGNVIPHDGGALDLGSSSRKWKSIYATNGTIQTSDRNEKNTIEELTAEKAQSLIYGLKPSTYQMNAGTSGRTHWGMISQDIEELFDEIGMTSLDFAGFIKSPKMTEEVRDKETGKIIKESEVVEGEYDYSLRYDEFIAPIIKVIQTQHEEIEALKQRIILLEQQTQI